MSNRLRILDEVREYIPEGRRKEYDDALERIQDRISYATAEIESLNIRNGLNILGIIADHLMRVR